MTPVPLPPRKPTSPSSRLSNPLKPMRETHAACLRSETNNPLLGLSHERQQPTTQSTAVHPPLPCSISPLGIGCAQPTPMYTCLVELKLRFMILSPFLSLPANPKTSPLFSFSRSRRVAT
ncbi:hypothetical protein CALVIDRAFT_93923 [Calocera viscosa TUFC12733]|uniref:Uncharacterized protein n=1 Tax=Calocera viscosa (strain TUFC12733) TaxID=1330018 RepID=A0A167MX55_CALVF|nr:hypothetical protein CALVIDRAFT_93923 [Calocera viscosa TUFC12733]